jgi:hypothetical protein
MRKIGGRILVDQTAHIVTHALIQCCVAAFSEMMLDLMAVLSCFILIHSLPKIVAVKHVSGKVAGRIMKETQKIFFHGSTAPSVPDPPHYRRLTVTHKTTKLARTPLDE